MYLIKKEEKQHGFTLIELLVVVAIISLLSSVVFASLNTARAKAKDAAVKQLVQQYRNLLQLEISETGTPTRLLITTPGTGVSGPWWPVSPGVVDCTPIPTGTYEAKAEEICNALVKLKAGAGGNGYLYVNGYSTSRTYRILAGLTTSNRYFCMDGSGAVNEWTWVAVTGFTGGGACQ